ncbi:MAG: response regulator [Planctomycetota bacterium]
METTPLGSGLKQVLIIDDDKTVLALTARMLHQAGFDVLTANGGDEGLRIFQEHPDTIRAVLVDMTMPQMNGEQTCAELRRIRRDIPVVISSGYCESDFADHLKNAGSIRFIQKPYRGCDLVGTFEEVLRSGDEVA